MILIMRMEGIVLSNLYMIFMTETKQALKSLQNGMTQLGKRL